MINMNNQNKIIKNTILPHIAYGKVKKRRGLLKINRLNLINILALKCLK